MKLSKRYRIYFIATWVSLWLLLLLASSLQGEVISMIIYVTPKMLLAASTSFFILKIHFNNKNNLSNYLTSIFLFSFSILGNSLLDKQPLSVIIFLQEFLNMILILFITFAATYGGMSFKAKRIAKKSKELRHLAEQRAINARLAPHTLFNMLNAIYSVSLKEPEKASSLILSLASIMRHLTNAASLDFTDAKNELNFIYNYGLLFSSQVDNLSLIEYDFPLDVDLQIPNLICVTLFENAVSHSPINHTDTVIFTQFIETDNGFKFTVINTIRDFKDNENHLALGIKTVRQRLDYLYPGSHRFVTEILADGKFKAEVETW
uniref:Putative two-component system sensor protein, no kinase domain n=1 Tax=Rheinheimera sp. BAL341 TaxID=1708203 RepID=A0A486XNE4_9GAMM